MGFPGPAAHTVTTTLVQTYTPYINVHLEAQESDAPGVPTTTEHGR